MSNQLILVLDFGGQYNQLIARRVRDLNVYCEVHPSKLTVEDIREKNPVGIILTGGPSSVYADNAPKAADGLFELGIPVLGICYGAQLMAHILGGSVKSPVDREYGRTATSFNVLSPLFRGLPEKADTWMSHTDYIDKMPEGFAGIASTESTHFAAMYDKKRKLYGLQFHPEVNHTENGMEILRNFLFGICGATGDWTMEDYAISASNAIKMQVGDGKVLLALSGGVDSAVCAALLSKVVGDALTCIFVDTGLMRKNEGDEVEAAFRNWNINLIRVNAENRFLGRLAGVSDPETKRKIIGEEFIRIFEEEAKKVGTVDFLAQGTIYPDVIESGVGDAAVIKSHHNVGGLPAHVDFRELIEPLRLLFKDEVRKLGLTLGLPDYMVYRQPFPGPGLAIRIIGEITRKKLDLLRNIDFVFRDEVAKANLDKELNQYFAVLTDMRSVGVMGDERSYDNAVALRAVVSTDFMTADWARIPYYVLEKTSNRIVNEIRGVNRIVYDITSKPPATIEWE